MDSVLWASLKFQISSLLHNGLLTWVTISTSIALTTKQVSGQLENEAFLWLVSIPGGCVCVCAVFSIILRHIVLRSQHHSTFYPPHSFVPQPTQFTAVVKQRNLFIFSFPSPLGRDLTSRQHKLTGVTIAFTLGSFY